MKTLEQSIASAFATTLNKWISAKKMKTVNQRNSTPEYKGCCATHDFCDSNVAMMQAFEEVVGREHDIESDEDNFMWNTAWQIAKDNKFKV